MTKKITFLIAAAFMLLTMIVSPVKAVGQTKGSVTFTFSDHYSSNTVLDATAISLDASIQATFNKRNGGTATQYYTNGNAVRWYGGGTLLIEAKTGSNATITNITINYTQTANSVSASVGTYSLSNNVGTWTGSASAVTFTQSGTTGQCRISAISVTYSTGGSTAVATPTITPNSGSFLTSQEVSIACATADATIYYTTDGSNPTTSSTQYTEAFTVTETTTVKAFAVKSGLDNSQVATATYTKATVMTVAEARDAIDDGTGTQGVYVTGIVSQIVTPWGQNNYQNITFNIVDQSGDEEFLQAFRCIGDDAPNVLVNDVVVVFGNLTKYGQTYEFAQGCSVVSLEHPVVDVEAPVITPASCGLETSMDVTITPADGTTIYYTTDGSDPDNSGTGYTTMQTIYGISETTTVKAIAYIGEQHSNVVSAVYTKITDIENITAVNTTYFVKGTVVATNSRGYVIGDGSEYVYVYLNAAPSVAVNDMVYVYGTTGTYGNIIQFTSSATISAASSTNYDGNPTATVITEVPNYSTGYHISTYLQYTGALTKTNSNYYINVGGTDIQISYPTTDQANTLTALNGKNVTVKGYFTGINSSSKFTTMLESVEEVAEPAITLAQYEYNLNADGGDAELTVTYTNMPADPQAVVIFYEIDGETALTENPNWITATINKGHNIAGHIDVNEGEARSAYFKVKGIDANDNEVYSNLVTINQEAAAAPSIVFETTSMNLIAGGESDRKMSFDYAGLGSTPAFSIHYYQQDGETQVTADTYSWLTATIENNKLNITAVANTGEARSAYLKVYGVKNENVHAESNLVTITQAAYVVDYATLPFSWAGNTSAPTGITNNGVGTYSSSPYLKFDGTGDYIILKINERPGTLTFDIKGNSFSGGTFKVQTSENGETYTDLKTYTTLGDTQNESFNTLGENVRYIKWIYTEKSSGNVALGNIALAVFDNTPTLSFNGPSANIGTYPTGEEITFDGITVSQNYLTENITLSVTKGEVTPNSIDAGADPTQVVWKYTPTEAGYTTTTITATSGTIEDSFEIQFVAKTPHSITIASGIEHGTVESNKETAIENENVDLTVTPEDGYELSEITVVDSDNNPIAFLENTYRFVMPDAAVTVSATFTQSSTGDEEWVLTNLADLTSDDVFVIVGDNGDTYAMSNDNGTSSAPSAVEVNVANNKLSGTIAANIQWNLSTSDDGYIFYPNGTTASWLYCTNTNNGVKVGTGDAKHFTLDDTFEYLTTTETTDQRYIGIYNSLDWRCYKLDNNHIHSNIAGQTFAFYKKTNGTTTPSITAANVSIAYDIEEGEIAYTINHPVEGGTVSAEINGTASWLYLDDVDQTNHKVPFLCDANDGAERAATVTLSYTYNTDETVTKSITITQAANPNVVDNISDITATGNYTVKGTIVAKSERGFIVGDGTGYVYYYNQNYDQSAYNIGDKVQLAGPVVAYGKVFEFNSETVVSASETSGYDPTNAYPTELTGAQMQTIVGSSDNRLSDFVVYHGTLSVNGIYYNITNIAGATTASGSISYPLNTDFASLDGEQVTVIGYFVGVSSTRYNTMIGAVVKTPSIVADDVTIQYNETSGSITYSISDAAEDGWFNAEVEDGSWITITQPIGNDAVAFTCDENTGDAARTQNVTLLYSYHNYQDTIEKVVTVTQQPHIVPVASITVDPTELNVNADEHDGIFTVAYENIETDLGASVVWFESDGVTVANEPEWITADIDDVTLVDYIIDANTGDARTAYFKVYGLDGDGEDVYSNLVTITQAAPVIDYATLPFEWEGGTKEDLVANVGVSGYGLGSNYAVGNAPYRVKFDTDGDYILVKTNEQPGEVTVGIKKLGGANASSITIKGSSNGEDFTTIQTFDNEGDANAVLEHTTTVAFNENDRYVMIYFNKPSGGSNVGVGPITIAQVDNTPSITLSAYTIEATAEETDGAITVTYKNVETDLGVEIHWFESTTSTAPLAEAPEWIDADFDSDLNVEYLIDANTGDARTTYFRVYGLDGYANAVYSDLVTVTQAAYIPPVTGNNYVLYTGNIVEGDYLIVYGNGAMKNTVSNNRLQYVDVTENTNNNVIITDDAAIVWHIAQSGDYWTIYSADANAYAASTGDKNKAQMLANGNDDKAKWTITGTEAYDFVNKANADANVNAYLRKNTTYGYACYAEGTGGSLSLYKKTELGKTFTATEGNAWNNPENWTPAGIPTADDNVFINGSVIINSDVVATANIVAGGTITIENGGQLIHNNAVNATLQRDITGYGNDPNVADGWYLIASPVDKLSTSAVATAPYDLYMYNEPDAMWYSNTGNGAPFTKLTRGIGYLYANASDMTLNFEGSMIATNTTNIMIDLDYTSSLGDDVRGFNLAGNPFTRNLVDGDITIQDEGNPNAYYITEGGSNLSAQMITETPIKPGQGFMIQVSGENHKLIINPSAKDVIEDRGYIKIVAGNENGYDNAFIQINNGNTLRKLNIGYSTSVYVMSDGDDYAAARVEELAGTMPVHFNAVKEGEYTITVNTKNIEASTLLLFDNFKNETIDLLETPTYSFKSSADDEDNRFKLIFDFNNNNYNGVEDNFTSEIFVYQSGDEIIVNGEGTLQIFNVLGRLVTSKIISGVERISKPEQTGVYIFRLNEHTQKLIIK